MTPCETPFFQWLDKLQRPVSRWLMTFPPFIYGMHGAFGAEFDAMAFAALCIPAGFTYWRRGDEKLKGLE